MKTKFFFFAFISVLAASTSLAQIIPFTFVKNCMSFERQGFTDDLTKKHFYLVEETKQKTSNKLMEGAAFYCNEKERELGNAEIDILSIINGTKKIAEFIFLKGAKHDYSKNYGDIYNQMNSTLNKTASFQSKKYKTEVTAFTKNNVYYYTYKINDVPVIVVANYKIEEEYF